MTSRIKIENIISCTVLAPSEITPTKLKEGRIPAGAALNKFKEGNKLEVILSKGNPVLICNEVIEFNEDNIRNRKTYLYDKVSDSSKKESRLALGTKFFKDMEKTDTIYLILH